MLSRHLLRPSILRAPQTPANYRLPPTISQLLSENATPATAAEPTTVCGWIKSIRKQKNVSFAVVTDGSSDKGLQAVILKKKGQSDEESIIRRLTNGAAVRLTGKLVESPGAGQSHELVVDEKQLDSIVVLGDCDPDTYPIQKKTLSNEYLRDNAHLRARTSQIAAMLRLRNTLTHRMGSWFSSQGFVSANTPILTGNDAEGAGEVFRLAPTDLAHPSVEAPPSSPSPALPTTTTLTTTSTAPVPSSSPPEFFSRPAFLTVSHQLHLEALSTALSRVYTLSPCFRAEPSATRRHLAEFWMLEAEWTFLNHLNPHAESGETQVREVDEVCNFVEAMLRGVVGDLISQPSKASNTHVKQGEVETRVADPDLQCLWTSKPPERLASLQTAFTHPSWWTRMTYTEAIAHLAAASSPSPSPATSSATSSATPSPPKTTFEYAPVWGSPIQTEHEKYLAETLIGGPVFVTDYPASLKPFYMRLNADGRTVACFDLLVPGIGELVGGSVREERGEVLRGRMVEAGLIPGSSLSADSVGKDGEEGKGEVGEAGAYAWYEDLRKYGGAPHAGFGMGFERLVGWIGGIENVRECVPMPRWAGRLLL